MDYDWMRTRLEGFLAACLEYDRVYSASSSERSPRLNELTDELTGQIPTVKKIVEQLSPDLVGEIHGPFYAVGMLDATRAVQQALGVIRDRDEWALHLAPDSPTLSASGFHRHVWDAAASLWQTSHYREATRVAATALSTHIAARCSSTLSDGGLVQAVFAPSAPTQGQRVRLHYPGAHDTDDWRSRQQGLHWLAQGAFAGIRNVSTHGVDEWPEHEALEQIATLSVVARWADQTELCDCK